MTTVIGSDAVDGTRLGAMYSEFKNVVVRSGYGGELTWQAQVDFETTTETEFLREAAWVVLSAGFRERSVRNCFGEVSQAFLHWRSAVEIVRSREQCRRRAMAAFANRAKIDAIVRIAGTVAARGFQCVKGEIRTRGVGYLQELPYIGPVTSFHLAKNLGLNVVKPDRHLLRMAQLTGYESPVAMCTTIAAEVGDPLAVVDIVCWRFATLNRDYVQEIVRFLSDPSLEPESEPPAALL